MVTGGALAAALRWTDDLDCSVFPLPWASKFDDNLRWSTYARARADKSELMTLFGNGNGRQNIAAITGPPSRNLLALDHDSRPSFADSTARLTGMGITTLVIRREANGSPHDGGGTILLRTPCEVASTKRGDIDVLAGGKNHYFVCYGAHPSGDLYYDATPPPIYEVADLTALAWLQLEPVPPRQDNKRLPRLAWRILDADTETLQRYHSRSEAEYALLCSLARSGLVFGDALALLQSHPGAGKFAEMDNRNGLRWLSQAWDSASEWVLSHDNDAGKLAQSLRQWALARPWRGRGASSERCVFIAHCDIVAGCGQDPHGASVRQLAELTGMIWRTVARANRRLVDTGLLELVTPATAALSHVWQLLPPDDFEAAIMSHYMPPSVVKWDIMADHDAFRRSGGLGKSGAEVLAALLNADSGMTARELADTTGRGVRTVRRKLGRMLPLGLVHPQGDGYWQAVADPNLDRVAIELGTAGAGSRQRGEHADERERHRRKLAKYARLGK